MSYTTYVHTHVYKYLTHVIHTHTHTGISANMTNQQRLAILSRLEHHFSHVDLDGSRTLDFFEYMYLSFLMTKSGSYIDFVQASTNPSLVKSCLVELNAHYK